MNSEPTHTNAPPPSKPLATPASMSWKLFLEDCPPGEVRSIPDAAVGHTTVQAAPRGVQSNTVYHLTTPDLNLFCSSEECGRKQFFQCSSSGAVFQETNCFLNYTCRNCRKTRKLFALRLTSLQGTACSAVKFGELPRFGPPIPAKLQRLIQPHRELFLKGVQCETRGLGIGAFAYFRRVVENEKSRLIDEIIRVCGKVNGGEAFIPVLKEAQKETQFSKAIEKIADAIPDALRISGHNPLTLLHSALSKGIHNQSDEQCLEAAHAIRLVLTEIAERMSEILKETAELQQAISTLMGSSSIAKSGQTKQKNTTGS
jgi:hypothetical protein